MRMACLGVRWGRGGDVSARKAAPRRASVAWKASRTNLPVGQDKEVLLFEKEAKTFKLLASMGLCPKPRWGLEAPDPHSLRSFYE